MGHRNIKFSLISVSKLYLVYLVNLIMEGSPCAYCNSNFFFSAIPTQCGYRTLPHSDSCLLVLFMEVRLAVGYEQRSHGAITHCFEEYLPTYYRTKNN